MDKEKSATRSNRKTDIPEVAFNEVREQGDIDWEDLEKDKIETVRDYDPNKSVDSSNGVTRSHSSDGCNQSIQSVFQPPVNPNKPVTNITPTIKVVQDKVDRPPGLEEDKRIGDCRPEDRTIEYRSELLETSQFTGTPRLNNTSFQEELSRIK